MFMPTNEACLVNPAIWVNESDFLSETEHASALAQRSGGTRVLFAARLIHDKGVVTVLAALRELATTLPNDADFRLDIIGSGPLLDECRRLSEELPQIVRVLAPVPYGAPFFELLRCYDAVLLANRQAEQPRIILDAFSQGIPCITSRTTGTESMVTENETGLFFEIDDVSALAQCLRKTAHRPGLLRGMSRGALDAGRKRTHHGMHRDRHLFLVETLGLGGGATTETHGA
jgi:glycosyltransferase involved in cell wall biosynthesis